MSRDLFSDPHRYDFFQAIRLLEKASGLPFESGIRLRTRPGVAFDASDVLAISPCGDDRFLLSSNLMSLAGAHGPLPMAYTEILLQLLAQRDHAATEFVDIFNQRFMQLLLLARRRVYASLGSPGQEQTVWQALRALTCLPLGPRHPGQALGPKACALFAMRQRSLAGLQALLSARLGLRVGVLPMVGRWQALGAEARAVLGATPLSSVASLGQRHWNPSGGIRLVLASRTQAFSPTQWSDLCPDGPTHGILQQCVKAYAGPALKVGIQLTGSQCPPPQGLGRVRLAWSSWLGRHRRASARFFMCPPTSFNNGMQHAAQDE